MVRSLGIWLVAVALASSLACGKEAPPEGAVPAEDPIAGSAEPEHAEPEVTAAPTKETLRVVLENSEWLQGVAAEVAEQKQQKPDAPDNRLVTRKFHGDLHEVLVVDTDQSVAMLTRADLAALGLSPVAAFNAGRANHASLPPVEDVEVAKGVWSLSTPDSYTAARLLLAERWPERATKVKGDLLVVAPSRDLVYFTGTDEPGGFAELQKLVRSKLPTQAHPLSATVLRWTDEGWVEYP